MNLPWLKHSVAVEAYYPEVRYLNEPEYTEDDDCITHGSPEYIHLLHQSYINYSAQSSYKDIALWITPHVLAII